MGWFKNKAEEVKEEAESLLTSNTSSDADEADAESAESAGVTDEGTDKDDEDAEGAEVAEVAEDTDTETVPTTGPVTASTITGLITELLEDPEQLHRVQVETVTQLKELFATKGAEYTEGAENALANFDKGAVDLGVAPEQVIFVYMHKHWTSISNYIKNKVAGGASVGSESITGRAQDLALYLILFIAMEQKNAN